MQSLSSLMTHNHLLLKSRHRPVYLIVSMKKGVNLYQKSKPSGFFFLIFSNHGVNIPPQVFVKQRSWSCATGEGVSVVRGMSWGESSKSGSSYRLLHAPSLGLGDSGSQSGPLWRRLAGCDTIVWLWSVGTGIAQHQLALPRPRPWCTASGTTSSGCGAQLLLGSF